MSRTHHIRELRETANCHRCGREFQQADVWPVGIPPYLELSIGGCPCGAELEFVEMFTIDETDIKWWADA